MKKNPYSTMTKNNPSKRILITGANGQLGTALRPVAAAHNWQVDWVDIDTLDLTDADATSRWLTAHPVDVVVNCAAYTAVDRAESDSMTCRRINTDAVASLGRSARACGARVLHISTDYVFDGEGHRPYSEDDPTGPCSVYGTTKRDGDMCLQAEAPDSIIVRTAWLYSTVGRNFVKTMIDLGRSRDSLKVVCDQVGTPTLADDLAEAIGTIVDHPRWIPGIYHFTDEGVTSWYDFAKAIHRLAGITSCKVMPCLTADYPTPARRPQYGVLDKTKFKRTFGVEIPYWVDSLKRCIEQLNP